MINIDVKIKKNYFIINNFKNPKIILDRNKVYSVNCDQNLYLLDENKRIKLNGKLKTSLSSFYIQDESGLIFSKVTVK